MPMASVRLRPTARKNETPNRTQPARKSTRSTTTANVEKVDGAAAAATDTTPNTPVPHHEALTMGSGLTGFTDPGPVTRHWPGPRSAVARASASPAASRS